MSLNLQGATGATINFVSGLLAVATSTGLFKTVTNTIVASIKGILVTKAPTDNIPFTIEPNSGPVVTLPNSFKVVAVGEACGFSIFMDSSAAITVAQGQSVGSGDKVNFPAAPQDKVMIGAFKVIPTAAFTPGTTALTSVSTFYNLSGHPGVAI